MRESRYGHVLVKTEWFMAEWVVILGIIDLNWLRYQRVISLKIQVGNTNQRNKWANTDQRVSPGRVLALG
jgi:hypothetical protein